MNLFREAAMSGNPEAQLNLGLQYFTGQGTHVDLDEAAKWFKLSAEQGYPQAQYALGLAYAGGLGVVYDYDRADALLRKAAEQGIEAAAVQRKLLSRDRAAR